MRSTILICLFSLSTASVNAAQGIPQIPEIPAFLPMAHSVPAGEPSPIDGEWVISSISKRIRIQGGRAFALDPWLHMFVLRVKPLMVVINNISTTDGQNYAGKDLPLMGAWNATLDRDGNLSASVQTAFGPIKYALMLVRVDDRELFELAKSGQFGNGNANSSEDEYSYEDEYEYDDEEEW
ncbi:MAG: hypothetical protein GKR90_14140 [Pseudomonadales bacterium]|nr:hypothetical protein [Pseudomonadales bacterium]